MTELIGILLVIQGGGALATRILDGSRSWFLVRHVVPYELQLPAAAVVLALGILVLVRVKRRKT